MRYPHFSRVPRWRSSFHFKNPRTGRRHQPWWPGWRARWNRGKWRGKRVHDPQGLLWKRQSKLNPRKASKNEHMKNCIGGCKKGRQSILETQHVRKIHDLLDPQKKDETIESLLKDGGLEVWKQWVWPMLDNKKIRVGSAKAYLSSLSKFCEFIVDHHENKVRCFPKVPSEIIKKAQAVAKHFKGMMSAVT